MDRTNMPEEPAIAQVKTLQQTVNIQSQLVGHILSGCGLDDLSQSLSDLMMCCVFVEDAGSSVLSVGFSCDTAAETRQLLRTYISEETISDRRKDYFSRAAPGKPLTAADTFCGTNIFRLVFAIRTAAEHMGYLSVIRTGSSFSTQEVDILQNASTFFALQLQQDKKIAEIELRLKGNFIEDLILTQYSNPDSIMNRARAINYNITLPHRVLVAEIENMKNIAAHFKHNSEALADYKVELISSIQNCIDQSSTGIACYHKDDILLVVQLETKTESIRAQKELSEKIIQLAKAQFKAKLFIGIGSICSEFSDYPKSYLSAKKSLEIGSYMITEGQVRSFEQFSVHALFMSTIKPAELYNYARGQLGALLDYDDTHHTELLKTLQEFLYLRNNIERTARAISMSVSGLKYRLKKIENIIGLDLDDYKVSFDLQLALVIMQLFGEYSIKPAVQ